MYFNSSTLAYIALMVALIGVVAIIPSYLKAKSERSTRPKQRWLLLGMRLLSIAIIVFIIFDPRATTQDETKESKEVAVLVDVSRSMNFMDVDSKTRWVSVQEEVAKIMPALKGKHHAKLYTFGDQLQSRSVLPKNPDSVSSDLGAALMALTRVNQTTQLGAVVVLSDGQVTSNKEVRDSAWALKKRGVVVHGIMFGAEEEQPDVVLRSINLTQPLPFERKLSLRAEVGSLGYEGREVLLSVKEEEHIVHEQIVTLNGKENQTINLAFLANQQGYQVLDVSLEVIEGERLEINNMLRQGVEIRDEKIRVLYMEGSHLTLTALPAELAKDPAMEVTTLFVNQASRNLGRDNYKSMPSMPNQVGKGLIYNVTHPEFGVPLDKEELFKYDVIINSDIFKEAFTKEQLDAMVEFVEEKGGGFVMVGGDTAFGSGDYDETVVDRILPVEIKYSNDTIWNSFKAKITDSGREHPILKVGATSEQTKKALEALPNFNGMNIVDRAKPGATILAVQSEFGLGNKKSVLWAVQQIGRGRSMAFTSDTTPDWGTQFESSWGVTGDSRKYYRAFWNNSIRWLSANKLSINNDDWAVKLPEPFLIGQEGQIELHYPDDREFSEAKFTVSSPDGRDEALLADETMDGSDGYRAVYTPTMPGNHHLTIRRETSAGPVFLKHLIYVPEITKELSTTKANPKTLSDIARITGGDMLQPNSSNEWVQKLDNLETNVIHFRDRSLWDRWWILLILIGLLSTGWYLRRKWGFA